MPKEKFAGAKEFAKEYWPEALAATLTIAGAASLLLIRYYRSKQEELEENKQLDALEDEAKAGLYETTTLLETGEGVISSIPDGNGLASEMAPSIPDELGRDAMTTLASLLPFKRTPKLK